MRNRDYISEIQKIIIFFRNSVHRTGKENVVIAVSGGIDSAVSLTLASRALGINQVYTLQLPYRSLSENANILGQKILDFNRIPKHNRIQIDIGDTVDVIIQKQGIKDPIRMGNIMARIRMIYLFDSAKMKDALVCGTENRSEHLLGYFTRFGDEASDIEPIMHLFKTEVYALARQLSIPAEIIHSTPTAGLWKGQSDEKEFGFSYNDADEIMYWYVDKQLTKEQIVKKGFQMEIVEKVIKRVEENGFKQKVPYKISNFKYQRSNPHFKF